MSSAAGVVSSFACGTSSTMVTLKLTGRRVAVLVGDPERHPGQRDRCSRSRRRRAPAAATASSNRCRSHRPRQDPPPRSPDGCGSPRSPSAVPTRSPPPSSANVTLLPFSRLQLAVEASRVHAARSSPAGSAGTSLPKFTTTVPLCRQRLRAVGLVRRARSARRSAAVREPVLVDRQVRRRPHQARNRIRRQRRPSPSPSRCRRLVGDRVAEAVRALPRPASACR